jgi:large subunit ribosomal protein L13
MKTYSPKPRDIERRWYVLDASGAVLGRLASQAAAILRGKHKPIFAPHMDTGDHVIVINAKDVTLSGAKEETKVAYRHSGHPGGITATKYGKLLAEKPAFAVEKAIKGMLPHNRLGRQVAAKLRVYAGPDHRHAAQQPQSLRLGEVPVWEGLPATPAPTAVEESAPTRPPSKATATRTTRKAPTSKPAASKSPAKRPAAKTATAKRSAAKRSTAKATTAKPAAKTTAKKTTASKTTKAPARKTAASRTKKES